MNVVNGPLKHSTPTIAKHSGNGRIAQLAAAQADERAGFVRAARALDRLAASQGLGAADRANASEAASGLHQVAQALPRTIPQRLPITTGVGEPFTVTLMVAGYFALLVSLPVILFQAYAFVLPAFSPSERRIALPVMLMMPALFAAGVLFAYYLVLPPAVSFLQNFNDTNFDVLIQARDYYRFAIMVLIAIGLVFQLPVGLLALDRVGIITAKTLTRNWRYAVVLIAVIAAALPGVDPVTTMLEMIPLLVLYGLSIVLLTVADRRSPAPVRALAALPPDPDEEMDD
jgi:sec-independent protein translocase protein TatC